MTPLYLVYDAFTRNPHVDWERLHSLGLGVINHVPLVEIDYPNLELIEQTSVVDGLSRRDVTWRTDRGELHEHYLGDADKGLLPWRNEYLVKKPDDYLTVLSALEGAVVRGSDLRFEQSETELAGKGLTIGDMDRTPLQKIQIDYVGLERFCFDFAEQVPQLRDLYELMRDIQLRQFRATVGSRATDLKLWENMSIEVLGPHAFRDFLAPAYRDVLAIVNDAGKRLHLHYDGRLKLIERDLQQLPFHGIDSLTPPPEGDLTFEEARQAWPDLFLWLHPTLEWFTQPLSTLRQRIEDSVRAVGPYRFCFQISEDVPPQWHVTVPAVLETLQQLTLRS